MEGVQGDEFERVSAVLFRLRELLPHAVPSSALQALYVHDDALSAIDDVTLTQAQRESLPEGIRSELEALEALFRRDPTG